MALEAEEIIITIEPVGAFPSWLNTGSILAQSLRNNLDDSRRQDQTIDRE